ncbi:MAG: MFS transporter [Gemmatimonadota bacterium]|nr:MFS transporter [Gemmatimonadota bacterium]
MRSLAGPFGFLRGNILVLTASGSLGMFSRAMVFPYVPLYVLALGGEPEQVGIVYALGPLGGLLAFPIAGHLADHMNRAWLIAAAGYFSAVAVLINAVAPSWEWVAAAMLIRGFAVFHFPASSALVADSLPAGNRGRGMATMTALTGGLALFAPFVAGVAIDAWGVEEGMRILYWVMGAAYAAGATINLIFIRETRKPPAEAISAANLGQTLRRSYTGIPALLRGFPRSLRAVSVVIILCFIANGLASPFWVVYAKTHIGLTASQWGLILLVEFGLRNLTTIPAGFLTDRFGRTRFIVAALLVTAATPLYLLAGSFGFVLAIRCAIGVAAAFFSPAMGALLADIVPSAIRGRVMAAIGRGSVSVGSSSGGTGGPGTGFLTTLPLMVAALFGGVLYAWSPAIPFLCVFGLTVVALLVSIAFVRDPKKAEE